MANMIMAICLRVLRAIIFLKSCSQFAEIPASSIVSVDVVRMIDKDKGKGLLISRIKINVPAVTRVDEWTRAEIGVGAAIAAGSQDIKGNWALFVEAAMIIRTKIIIENSLERENSMIPLEKDNPIEMIIRISPIRLDKIVIAPDSFDFTSI